MAGRTVQIGNRCVRHLLAAHIRFYLGMTGQAEFSWPFFENKGLVAGVWRMAGQAISSREWLMFTAVGGGVAQSLMAAETEFTTLFFCFEKHVPVAAMGLVATAAFSSGKRVVQAEASHFLSGRSVT